MIDFRYHALSLAAVLFALALGVLLGVAIGDSNLVSSAKSGIVHSLQHEVQGERSEDDVLRRRLVGEEALAGALYPLTIHGLLAGRQVGLVFLGGSSDSLSALVRSAVTAAGGTVATVVAVRAPLDLPALAGAAAGTRFSRLAGDPALVRSFGQVLGRELLGGDPALGHSLLARVRRALGSLDGQLVSLEGLVLVRAEPAGMDRAQREAESSFEAGLLGALHGAGVPGVGVERTGSEPSQVPWYRSMGLASVDDLDALAGQAALVLALDGAKGSFGVGPGAQSLLPAPG